jgi:creatinine amidohydrolase
MRRFYFLKAVRPADQAIVHWDFEFFRWYNLGNSINGGSMRLADLNWFDVESYLQHDDRVILVIGSCEQHGYLSLLTDTKIPMAIADAASQRMNVLVAPEISFGASPYFLAYPGTISLRIATLLDLVEDVVRSLYRHGFHKILIINGHGGNDPVRARMYELKNVLAGLRVAWFSWWNSNSVEEISRKYEIKPFHGGWLEAFPFTRVAELPENEKNPPYIPGLLGADEARKIFGDGVFGGKYRVDDVIMQELFNVLVEDVIHLLNFDNG